MPDTSSVRSLKFLDRTVAADLIGKKQLVPNTTDIICISPRKYVLSCFFFLFFLPIVECPSKILSSCQPCSYESHVAGCQL